jgi:putative IMPACT (imprinted ancient) family translation regulator
LDGNSFRASDDGEPSGTAGRPILGQIDSKGLVNVLVVVVRYFGGTLLGVPGLIHAYRSAAALVLQMTPVIQRQVEQEFRAEVSYRMKEMRNVEIAPV